MSQESSTTTTTIQGEIQLSNLAQALMTALGMKPSTEEGGQKIQSASIFLQKLFKKYSIQKGKRFNEVKLNRLNGMIYKVYKDPPTANLDIQLIYQIILCFFYNEGTFLVDDNSFASNTCIWVGKFIEEILALKFPAIAIELLQTVLGNKKPSLISPQTFQKNIAQSLYFRDKQINKDDEINANKRIQFKGFMSEYYIHEQLKSSINIETLFLNLYKSCEQKSQVLNLFTNFCRVTTIQEMKEIFIKVFIQNKKQTKQSLAAILITLDNQIFSFEDFHEIMKILLKFNDHKLFYSVQIKNMKNLNAYIQILSQTNKTNFVDELAQIFISEKKTNNYFLIYLINKSNKKLSQKFLDVVALNNVVTNRQAIICSLCITHNTQTSHSKIMKLFFNNEQSLTNKQKIDLLKLAHFSYINVPKIHLLTQIIKLVAVGDLDLETNFHFLPQENYEKKSLDKNQREELHDFLSRYFGNSDDVYWIKLDLYSICGKELAYMQQFKKIQKIFENPIDQVVTQLPNLPENLLQIVLMGVNNKLGDQFSINQNLIGQTLQWALQSHKKQHKKFKNITETYLKKTNNQHLLDLCIQVFDFNLDQKTYLQINDDVKSIITFDNLKKLSGLNFSQYFMSTQTEQTEPISSLLKSKNLIVEYQKLIKWLTLDNGRTQNRKQLKTLISQQSSPLRALKIIKLLSQTPYQKAKNPQKLKNLTQTLLQYIKPEFEHLKQLASRSGQVNINYCPINESLQFLISINYQKTVTFISNLLKSKPVKLQQKPKKTKRKTGDTPPQKSAEPVLENLQFCFKGDPNILTSYQPIITIIQHIRGPNNDESKQQLIRWMSKIKIFYTEQYNLWKEKLINYIQLWQSISSILLDILNVKEIQRHFLIMINLLNTLYEKYRQEKDVLNVQKRILNGLYILYNMAKSKSQENQMEEQKDNDYTIPKQKFNELIVNFQVPQPGIPHIYYCYDCSKKVCHDCAPIIHKNHDKNYIGPGNQADCHRYTYKNRDNQKKSKQKYNNQYNNQKWGRQITQNQREKQLEKLQKFMLLNQSTDKIPAQILMRFKEKQAVLFKKNQRILSNDNDNDEQDKKKEEGIDDLEHLQIKSCSEKQFIIKGSNLFKKSSKPKPTFEGQKLVKNDVKPYLNMMPLFNLLIRELKSQSFTSNMDIEGQQKNTVTHFEADLSNEKYLIIKVEYFKNNINNNRMGAIYLGNSSQQSIINSQSFIKRNVLAINDRFLGILTGSFASQVYYLNSNLLRTKFIKKENQKRYKQNDTLENYQLNLNKINQPSILQITFSPFSHNLIAQISTNKILFEQISKEGRNRLICVETGSPEIYKFQWIKASGLKSFYSYLTNQINLGKIGKRQIEFKQKIGLPGKKIKDYSNSAVTSKIISMTILDNEGKLYRANIDIYEKRIPNFLDYQINLNYNDIIVSVLSQGSSLYCTTTGGKILVITLNEDNTLQSIPISFPVIQNLRSHKISQINSKIGEVSKISKLRFISKSKGQIFLACLLTKQNANIKQNVNMNDLRKSGYFVIISLNVYNKKSKIVMYNDQGITDSYDFINLSEKEFMFVCLQEDGELWTTKLTTSSRSGLNKNSDFILPLTEIGKYIGELTKLKLVNQIQFFNDERKYCFKDHGKITDHFKTVITDNVIKFEMFEKFLTQQFITGIQFGVTPNIDANTTYNVLAFNFLGNSYKFFINRAREIQIPLTIKQVMMIFVNKQDLKLQFIEGHPLENVKDISIFGVKVNERSPYIEAFTNLSEVVSIYKGFKDANIEKKIQNYFYNEIRDQLKSFQPKSLEQYFNKKKITIAQQNLLMKLQLLRQSIEGHNNDQSLIVDCFDSIRNHILLNINDRKELTVSVYKLCRRLTESCNNPNILKLGHPLNYETHLDIYNAFKYYKYFRSEPNIDNYQDFLIILRKIFNSRTINAYIILSVYPEILKQVCIFFKKIMSDYKIYFKVNQFGLEKDQKLRLNKICSLMMRLLTQHYQLQKNRNQDKNCEEQLLRLIQIIFCLQKKQIHRQIRLNPFQYLSSIFEDGEYVQANPPLNFLQIEKIDIQQPKKSIESAQIFSQAQNLPTFDSNRASDIHVIRSRQSQRQNQQEQDPDFQESCQEHKEQQEQNREMLDDFAYEIQPQATNNLIGGQRMIEQDQQQQETSNKNEKNGEQAWKNSDINTKKIYDFLSKQAQSMTPQQTKFYHHEMCQNLLIEIFNTNTNNKSTNHKYLNSDNLVLYVGLVYNLMYNIEKKLIALFSTPENIDLAHPYIQNKIYSIIQAIDNKIDNPLYSVLYLPLNSIIALNPKSLKQKKNPIKPSSMFVHCLLQYYKQNMLKSKFLHCITTSQWHPQQFKQPASLSSVLKFEYFDLVNPIYQLKYAGNLFLNLQSNLIQIKQLEQNKEEIKRNFLKIVVKYNLKVYKNIMVIQGWSANLQQTKINVAFDRLKSRPQQSLRAILKSLTKDPKIFVKLICLYEDRITDLEGLLGSSAILDQLILQILNAYYSYEKN